MRQPQVKVVVERRAKATVVRVSGIVDGLSLTDVSRALTDAQRDAEPVYVDLSEVSFIDSRGLGALLAANERSREGAAPVRIFEPSDPVRRLLEVAGLQGVLKEAAELPAS